MSIPAGADVQKTAMPIGSPFATAGAVSISASVHHSTGMSTVPRTMARCASSKDEESIFGFDDHEDTPCQGARLLGQPEGETDGHSGHPSSG